MPPPQALYSSIRLVRWIQMVCFPTLSARLGWSYLLVCTFVLRTGIFRLFTPESYKHATGLMLIPLYLACSPDSNSQVSGPFPTAVCRVFLKFLVLFPGLVSIASSYLLLVVEFLVLL